MPKVILHVGAHKTGTTALQHSLNASRNDLEKWHICYDPNLGGKNSRAVQHHSLAGILGEPDTHDVQHALNGYRRFLQGQLDRGRDVVISSEKFYRMEMNDALDEEGARHRYLERVANFFDGMPVEVVIYFRRPDRFIESAFKENAIKPRPKSFEACIARDTASVSYAQRLQEFEAHFAHVSCFCFEDAAAEGLVEKFLRRHGLAERDLEKSDVHRQGVSFRAALWLVSRNGPGSTTKDELYQTWLFCLDMGQHPLLKDAKSDRPWTSSDQRLAYCHRMLQGFRHADFWSVPEDEWTPVNSHSVDLDAIDALYRDWLQHNQRRLEMRRRHKVRPYEPDLDTGSREGIAYAIWSSLRRRARL